MFNILTVVLFAKMIVIIILYFAMYKYKKTGLILAIYTIVVESFFLIGI